MSDTQPFPIEDDRVETLPHSDKLVYLALEHQGPATRSELVHATGVSPRTVSDALDRLAEAGVIECRPHADDGRKHSYGLAD